MFFTLLMILLRTGPGYLIDATQNTVASEATQTVMYTTGSYVIREVPWIDSLRIEIWGILDHRLT